MGQDSTSFGLPELQTWVASICSDPSVLRMADIDHDNRISQVESLVFLYRYQESVRRRMPMEFARVDGNGDRSINRAEIRRLVDRSSHPGFILRDKHTTLRPDRALANAGGTGASLGIGGSQHAYVFFGTQQAYIQDYDVVNGSYDPVIGIIGSGVVLDVSDLTITVDRHTR